MNNIKKIREILREIEGFPPSKEMVESLFSDYIFDHKIVSSLTPIKKGGVIDTPIYRPDGMTGWIINLTVKGKGKICLSNGNCRTVSPGDICLFPPKIVHHYMRHEVADEWYHRWIYFRPYRQWANYLKWKDFESDTYFMSLNDRKYEQVDSLFEEIMHEFRNVRFLSFEVAINLLERILLICQQVDQNAVQWKNMDEKVLMACAWISENLKEPISIQDIANQVALSPSQLSHLFKKQMGHSPIAWKNHQLINQAALDIRNSEKKISQIAIKYGFDDPFYFSRCFKKIQGISPKQYRELWRKEPT